MLNEVKHLSCARVRRDSSIALLFQNDTRGIFEMASSHRVGIIYLKVENSQPLTGREQQDFLP